MRAEWGEVMQLEDTVQGQQQLEPVQPTLTRPASTAHSPTDAHTRVLIGHGCAVPRPLPTLHAMREP